MYCIVNVERGGALVESTPVVQRVTGLTPALAARDLGQVLHSQLPVALRCEIPAQYPCRVVVDLKRHYRNSLNE